MKHIVFFSTVYPTPWQPHKGPANARLVSALRELGYLVSVIAPMPWVAWRPKHETLPSQGAEFPVYWYVPGIRRHTLHNAMYWSVRTAMERILSTQPAPSAVLAFWTHPDGAVALRFGKEARIPVGIIAAGSDIMLLPRDPRRREEIAKTVRKADHIFAVGREIARRVVLLGAPPERVSTFVQGVDLRQFTPGDRLTARIRLGLPPAEPLLLWVGNMVDVKAAHRAILATRRLEAQFPTIQLAMVGGGPKEAMLKRMAEESGHLAQRIHFPGALGSAELATWYQAADAFVLPSKSEGVPNVLLEAMATGLPFVASHVGSIPDLLPFGPSTTTPEGDIDALVASIGAVLLANASSPIQPIRRDIMEGARQVAHYLRVDSIS